MDRSTAINLIGKVYTTDAIGQMIATETSRKVFCNMQSVTRAEFFAAGENGFKPELRATMFAPDYKGEETIEYNGIRYSIYRTYYAKNDMLELYLERKAGS